MIRSVWLFLKALPANLKKLFTSLSFLRLKNRDLTLFQWVLPTVGAVTFFCLFLNPICPSFAFDAGLLFADINMLVGILVGFYIAALAAVSTFPSENLDIEMAGLPTTLKTKRKGEITSENLTRRRYLAILFGYCSFVSIILFVVGVLQTNLSLSNNVTQWIHTLNRYLFYAIWFAYIWLICSLFSATFVGLHYLVDRMHRP